ncbi:tail assembly chaperone [Gordonia phage Powerball]|uniref:Tail assembly chaperone n=1 Tax=Gordonia phage Powerball TaxID=2599847 RepID=A0A5J6TRR1_9CAUD|nr:tail assembly chaperone [Gordonia phage Powerball]QFG13451.1 tail assembly chaperone [Gordonia phage Powerball]
MGFQDLSEFFTPGLQLPIRGKTYTIPAPSAQEGLRLRMLFSTTNFGLSDEAETAEIMKLLGAEWKPNIVSIPLIDPTTGAPAVDDKGNELTHEMDQGTYEGGVFQEMSDDGLTWPEIMHAGRTAMLDIGVGRTLAEVHWQTGLADDDSGNPLPPKPGEIPDPEFPNRAAKRAAKKAAPKKKVPAKKAGSKAATDSSTRARKRTATTTPGGGDYNPVTGMRDWYYQSPPASTPTAQTAIPWSDLLEQWTPITLDLHEVFGVDVESGVLQDRTWRWLENRIRDLLFRGPRLNAWRLSRGAVPAQ